MYNTTPFSPFLRVWHFAKKPPTGLSSADSDFESNARAGATVVMEARGLFVRRRGSEQLSIKSCRTRSTSSQTSSDLQTRSVPSSPQYVGKARKDCIFVFDKSGECCHVGFSHEFILQNYIRINKMGAIDRYFLILNLCSLNLDSRTLIWILDSSLCFLPISRSFHAGTRKFLLCPILMGFGNTILVEKMREVYIPPGSEKTQQLLYQKNQ